MSQYPYYNYDNSYYDEMHHGNASSSASAIASAYTPSELFPPVTSRKRPVEIPPPRQNSSSSSSRPRDSSPPRKTSRVDLPQRPTAEVGRYNRVGSGSASERERPTTTKNLTQEIQSATEKLSDALDRQQDVFKERMEVEANNAKFERYRGRDDISKENKAKADKALEEIKEVKRKSQVASKAVARQVKVLIDVVSMMQTESRDCERTRTREERSNPLPRPSTPPRRPTSSAISEEREPGEIASPRREQVKLPSASTLSMGPVIGKAPVPSSVTVGPSTSGKAKEMSENSITRSSVVERFGKIEDSLLDLKSDTEDRLNQFESALGDLVVLEVRNQRTMEREARKIKAAEQTKGTVVETASLPSTTVTVDRTAEGGQAKAGETEVIAQRTFPIVQSEGNCPTPTTAMRANGVVNSSEPMQRRSRSEEPGMSQEQVVALIESRLQAQRQEFDTKLFEQDRAHQAQLLELRNQIQIFLHKDQSGVKSTLQHVQDVLGNHVKVLEKHDKVQKYILDLFASVPKPQVM